MLMVAEVSDEDLFGVACLHGAVIKVNVQLSNLQGSGIVLTVGKLYGNGEGG